VQLVCGQRAVCQRYGSLSDSSQQQQQQQHADRHVGSCHVQKEMHYHVEDSSNHLTSELNNSLVTKTNLLFIGN
jgi:hypothetical protein